MSEVKQMWHELKWLQVRWLVYIVSFFIPVFGWVTFWVFSGREPELKVIARGSMIASFVGTVLLIILAAVGLTMFPIPLRLPGR
jgi:hypothetical protein